MWVVSVSSFSSTSLNLVVGLPVLGLLACLYFHLIKDYWILIGCIVEGKQLLKNVLPMFPIFLVKSTAPINKV